MRVCHMSVQRCCVCACESICAYVQYVVFVFVFKLLCLYVSYCVWVRVYVFGCICFRLHVSACVCAAHVCANYIRQPG